MVVVAVELPEDGVVALAEPLLGAAAAGAEVVPVAEEAAPVVLGARTAVGFTEENCRRLEEAAARAAVLGGAPARAAAGTPRCDPRRLALARGLLMSDTSGANGERSGAACFG